MTILNTKEYLSIDEDFYKPVIINDAFNRNYIECGIKWGKDKTLSNKEYLNTIKPYLKNIINDDKAQREWKFHSNNTIIEYKTQ